MRCNQPSPPSKASINIRLGSSTVITGFEHARARAASGRRGKQAAAGRHTACSQRCVRRAGEPRLSPPAPRRGGDEERGCGYLRLRLLAGGPLRARGCCSGDAERRCSSSGVPICVIQVDGRPLRAGGWGGVVPAIPCRRGALRCGVRCEGSNQTHAWAL